MRNATAMKMVMINAIPKDTTFPKFKGEMGPTTIINAPKQVVIPIRYTEGTEDSPPKKLKAKAITRNILRHNIDGTVVDQYGEIWDVENKGEGKHLWAVA